MLDVNALLFEVPYDGRPLFRSQSELIAGLLKTKQYHIDSQDLFEQSKILNRLKTYISQLLSGSGNRSITREFRDAMDQVLTDRFPDSAIRSRVLEEVFDSMREKSATVAREAKPTVNPSFQQQVASSSYLAVITSTQVKVELAKDGETISLGDFLVTDLLNSIRERKTTLKKYRFNFPLKTDCEVFWIGVRSALNHRIFAMILNPEEEFPLQPLVETINLEFQEIYVAYKNLLAPIERSNSFEIRIKAVNKFTNACISFLNKRKIIRVFATEDPIFTVPVIVLEPTDVARAKLFLFVEDEKSQTHVMQCSGEFTLLWRRFVWNKLITSKVVDEIYFPESTFETS